ncbi:MAG: sulfatase-like hydrolase/transferase [Rubripirellula sp.]
MQSRILFLIFAAIVLSKASPGFAEERPNILFIYTDDQSSRTVGCYPEAYPWVKTPNIDRLAKQGVRFAHAYIGAWCMPSRASLLTGHHQHGIESMRMAGTYPGSAYDPEKCPFWPSAFRKGGYHTAHIGKWHTGVDGGYGRDWDHQIIWNRPKYVNNAPNYYDDQLIERDGGEPKLTKGYSTDNYTNWAIEYINGENRDSSKPWYLWLCYGAVHGPFTPADRHLNDYPGVEVPAPVDVYPPRKGKPEYASKMEFWEPGKDGQPVERQVRKESPVGMKDMPGRSLKDWVRQYHQGVLAIDEGVGRLLTALKDSGQDENTLIVFTSDQGFAWGQHGSKSKVAPHRSAVAAPLIVRLPSASAATTAGHVVEHPVSGVDLPTTFFAQAGMELPWEMHGRDLTPLLQNANQNWEHAAMLVHTARDYGSATNRIPAADDPALYHGPGIPWYVTIATRKYKYIRTLVENETEELYDVQNDRAELINLATQATYRPIVEKMRAEALAELKRTKAGFVDELPTVKEL